MVMWQKAHSSVLVSQLWTSLVVEWADWAISIGELEHYVFMLSFLLFLNTRDWVLIKTYCANEFQFVQPVPDFSDRLRDA
jgi:hypothetical protein